jgi:glutamyl-tRNA reductase
VALRERAEEIKKEELDKLLNKLPVIGEKEKEAIEYMATALVNKLIHPPTAALKEASEDKDTMAAIIRKLYGINGEVKRESSEEK